MDSIAAGNVPASAIAQTNLQLYLQLQSLGWDADSLLRVRVAYDRAAAAFAGLLRGSGKVFLAHLVGTASITALGGGSVDLTLAALLHAWRLRGVRVLGRRLPLLRPVFPRSLEPAVRELICGYELVHRRYRLRAPDAAEFHALTPLERDVLLVHLANEIEEFLDFGVRVSGSRRSGDRFVGELLQLAALLEQPALAALLSALVAQGRHTALPAVLHTGRDSSYRP